MTLYIMYDFLNVVLIFYEEEGGNSDFDLC